MVVLWHHRCLSTLSPVISPVLFWFHVFPSSHSCGKCCLNSTSLDILCATSKKRKKKKRTASVPFLSMHSCFMYSWLNQQKCKCIYLECVLNKYFGGLEIRDQCSFVNMHKCQIHFFIIEWFYLQWTCKLKVTSVERLTNMLLNISNCICYWFVRRGQWFPAPLNTICMFLCVTSALPLKLLGL